MTNGSNKARDVNVDVVETTRPESRALRWILERSSWNTLCSFFVGSLSCCPLPFVLRPFLDKTFREFSQAASNLVFFSVVWDKYMAANTERAPAAAPPKPVANICKLVRAAEAPAAIMPNTENIPSIDPKTTSAARLPVSWAISSVV